MFSSFLFCRVEDIEEAQNNVNRCEWSTEEIGKVFRIQSDPEAQNLNEIGISGGFPVFGLKEGCRL